MIDRLDQMFRFHHEALNLRAQRQQLLASNIANADTPGYQAKDFDFSRALQDALSGSAGALSATSERHLPALQNVPAAQNANRGALQASADGNTVDMDVERAKFAENAIHYEANLTILASRIKELLAAIQG